MLKVFLLPIPVTNHPPATGAETMTTAAANLPALTPSAALALDKLSTAERICTGAAA